MPDTENDKRRSALKLLRFQILLILGLTAIRGGAQYRVLPGNTDSDGFPMTPARLCLGATGTAHCYSPPNYMKDAPFGLDPKAQTVAKLNGQELTLFTATFSDGGSGDLTNFALLTVKNGDLIDILPKVQLTNQSEYKLWKLPQFSPAPILVTADFVWDWKAMTASNYREETHLARHRYAIKAFVFDPKTGQDLKRVDFTTIKKYPGPDEADEIHVLDPEKLTILAKLQTSQTN